MPKLSTKIQGVKGGNPQWKDKNGYVTTFLGHSEDFISVDAYDGSGSSYKERETLLIEVYENGKLLFSGNKYELFEILKGK